MILVYSSRSALPFSALKQVLTIRSTVHPLCPFTASPLSCAQFMVPLLRILPTHRPCLSLLCRSLSRSSRVVYQLRSPPAEILSRMILRCLPSHLLCSSLHVFSQFSPPSPAWAILRCFHKQQEWPKWFPENFNYFYLHFPALLSYSLRCPHTSPLLSFSSGVYLCSPFSPHHAVISVIHACQPPQSLSISHIPFGISSSLLYIYFLTFLSPLSGETQKYSYLFYE